jgi:hypothetical protein
MSSKGNDGVLKIIIDGYQKDEKKKKKIFSRFTNKKFLRSL